MYCHHWSPLFHQTALPQSGQDIQQQRTRGLVKISQHENTTIHTNIKTVSWITQYKQHKLPRVMTCLKLYLSHVLLLAVFFMVRQIILISPTSFGIFFLWLDSPSGPRLPHCQGFVITLRHRIHRVTSHASCQ